MLDGAQTVSNGDDGFFPKNPCDRFLNQMLGDRIDATEAHRLGIVNRVVPENAFRDETKNFARCLANGPPETLSAIKVGIYQGMESTLPETLSYEYETQRRLFLRDDAREGMKAFLEKRSAVYGDRRS